MFSTYDLWAIDRMEKETDSLGDCFHPIEAIEKGIQHQKELYTKVGKEALFGALACIIYFPLFIWGLADMLGGGHVVMGLVKWVIGIAVMVGGYKLDSWKEKQAI